MDSIYFITIFVACIATSFALAETGEGSTFYFGNKTATLSCNISSSDPANLTWYFKDERNFKESHISSGDKYNITRTSTSIVLVITKPTRDDAGQYIVSGNKNCTVNYIAAPLVLDMVKSLSVEKDDSLDIVCNIRGYPPSEVVWQRNGVNLTVTKGGSIELNKYGGHMNAQLVIKDVQYSDEGTYTCIAYSPLFNSSSTKSLVVRVKNPIAWVWPLIGIIVEIVLLGIVIFICVKLDKRRAIRADFSDSNQSGHGHSGARKHDDKHD